MSRLQFAKVFGPHIPCLVHMLVKPLLNALSTLIEKNLDMYIYQGITSHANILSGCIKLHKIYAKKLAQSQRFPSSSVGHKAVRMPTWLTALDSFFGQVNLTTAGISSRMRRNSISRLSLHLLHVPAINFNRISLHQLRTLTALLIWKCFLHLYPFL